MNWVIIGLVFGLVAGLANQIRKRKMQRDISEINKKLQEEEDPGEDTEDTVDFLGD